MRAKHKYNKHNKEGARRIAQSYGYKTGLYDNPQLMGLLEKAGIFNNTMSDSDKITL